MIRLIYRECLLLLLSSLSKGLKGRAIKVLLDLLDVEDFDGGSSDSHRVVVYVHSLKPTAVV